MMIDIHRFCSHDNQRNFIIRSPWSRGDFTFATNGHIAVRVPRRPDVTREEGPNIETVFQRQPPPKDLRPVPVFESPESANQLCVVCMGRGWTKDCPEMECEDGMVVCDFGHDHECEDCTENGEIACHQADAGSGPCGKCGGRGRTTKNGLALYCELAPGFFINPVYAAMIVEMPNAKIDHGPNDSGWIWFTFDGGDGLIMPMRPPPEFNKFGEDWIIKPKVSQDV